MSGVRRKSAVLSNGGGAASSGGSGKVVGNAVAASADACARRQPNGMTSSAAASSPSDWGNESGSAPGTGGSDERVSAGDSSDGVDDGPASISEKVLKDLGISDEDLFSDPPPREDCPICMVPMPFSIAGTSTKVLCVTCCGKRACVACFHATVMEMDAGNMHRGCPFCRAPAGVSEHEHIRRVEKRVEAGEAEALYTLGEGYNKGRCGLPKDTKKALELYTRAAELGSLEGHFAAAHLFSVGRHRDLEKMFYHNAVAAMGGHEQARHNLGTIEGMVGATNRAMKHHMIAASAGHEGSLQKIGEGFRSGHITKDEYAKTLRAFQDSKDAMKSEQRSKATAAGL